MTTSVFVANMAWVFLFANWVAEWNWREKFADFRHNRLLHAVIAIAAVHLIWLITTQNMAYAFNDIQKKLPLIAIPLVILTSRPLDCKERLNVALAYTAAVLTVSVIGFVRYLTIPDLPYRDIIPYISHIRFGLNICMTLVLLAYTALRYRRKWLYLLNLAISLWLLFILLILHAYTSFIILILTPIILFFCYRKQLRRRTQAITATAIIALLAAIIGTTCYYCHDYYNLKPLSTQEQPACTANGNPYLHRNDGLIENGNYIHNYVCEKEMRQEWEKLSCYPFDSVTPVGYTVYPALLRYLNGLGYTKDSLGMTHLTPDDVAAIEKGIANPVYQQHGLRKMYYVLCYEYENYRCYRSISNFSMLQRLELWRAGWQVLRQHPLFGVGTGDVPDELHQQLHRTNSPLADTQLHTHNQYLNFLIAFGIIGFGLMAWFFVRAVLPARRNMTILFAAFLCILLISFISEDTLETLAGITFSAMGFSLLPQRISETIESPITIHPSHKTTLNS